MYFAACNGGTYDIWRIELQGAGLTQIIRGPANERYPVLRANREQIMYASDTDGDWELYYKDARDIDAASVRVTDNSFEDIEACWLHIENQNKILYAVDNGGVWSSQTDHRPARHRRQSGGAHGGTAAHLVARAGAGKAIGDSCCCGMGANRNRAALSLCLPMNLRVWWDSHTAVDSVWTFSSPYLQRL